MKENGCSKCYIIMYYVIELIFTDVLVRKQHCIVVVGLSEANRDDTFGKFKQYQCSIFSKLIIV